MKTNKISLVKLCETADVKPARLDNMKPLDQALANFGMSAESLAKEAASHAGGQEEWEDTKKIPDANILLTVTGNYDGVTIFVDAIDPNYGVPGDWEGLVGEEFPVPNAPLEEVAESPSPAEHIAKLIYWDVESRLEDNPFGFGRDEDDDDTSLGGYRHFEDLDGTVTDRKTGKKYDYMVSGEADCDGYYDNGDYDTPPYSEFRVNSITFDRAEVYDPEDGEPIADIAAALTSRK